MRGTHRLLASVKAAAARYPEAGQPTGLTGLSTHGTPRSALLYLYASTLATLGRFPEHSVYRQSTEALTRHRMAVVAAVKPPGYDEWAARAKKLLAEHPEKFGATKDGGIGKPFTRVDGGAAWRVDVPGGESFLMTKNLPKKDIRDLEWDGEVDEGGELEGLRSAEERADIVQIGTRQPLQESKAVEWEDEPALTVAQVEEIEAKIGAGLIEEVIEVAEAEDKLANIMLEHKVWESLEEKPVEGQWTYFERKST